MWRKGTLIQCSWECKLVLSLQRTVWRFFRKLKMTLPYDPIIPLLDIYLKKKTKILNIKCYMQLNICGSVLYNSQDMEAT